MKKEVKFLLDNLTKNLVSLIFHSPHTHHHLPAEAEETKQKKPLFRSC